MTDEPARDEPLPPDEALSGDERREARIRQDVVVALAIGIALEDGTTLEAQCLEASAGGVEVRLPRALAAKIRGGAHVRVSLRHPSRDKGLASAAEVTSVEVEGEDAYVCARFLDVAEVVRQMDPFYRRWLNRRRHARVVPASVVPARVRGTKDEVHGRIHDISLGGVGVAVDVAAVKRLEGDATVVVSFALPGAAGTIECRARVAVVKEFKREALVGLAFEGLGRESAHAQAIQRFVDEVERAQRRAADAIRPQRQP